MKLISVAFLVLLVASSGLAAWQYNENARLVNENERLKRQLDTQAQQLQTVETEKQQLGQQLNQTHNQTTELQNTVSTLEQQVQQLEENITRLREQLKIKGYTTIGLTFLWNPRLSPYIMASSIVDLVVGVEGMDDVIWDRVQIYFFVFHAEAENFMPEKDLCLTGFANSWKTQALGLYPEHDIPVGIVRDDLGMIHHIPVVGCAYSVGSPPVALVMGYEGLDPYTLSHEILHVLSFTDQEIQRGTNLTRQGDCIPIALLPRIQSAAKQFQMPLPDNYEF